MIFFLRLFRQFRDLEEALDVANRDFGKAITDLAQANELCAARGEAMRAYESENGSLAHIIEDLRSERLQDQARIVELTKEIVSAKDSEISAVKLVADFGYRARFGRSVFAAGVISEIPQREEAQHQPIARQKQQASAVIDQLEKEFDALMRAGQPEAVSTSKSE